MYRDGTIDEVADLYASVNNPERKARITFLLREVHDSNGKPKDVVTDVVSRQMEGSVQRWTNQSFTQRMMTVAMEMSLLLKIPERYNLAYSFRRNSLFGDLNPKMAANFLPAGTRLITTGSVVIPGNATLLGFVNGKQVPSDRFDARENYLDPERRYTPENLRIVFEGEKRGCILFLSTKASSSRRVSELVLRDSFASTAASVVFFKVSTPISTESNGIFFSFWMIRSTEYLRVPWEWVHEEGSYTRVARPTIGDLLTAIGTNFHIVLPPDQDF